MFSIILPKSHQDEINCIHERVSKELAKTEKKIRKLNTYLESGDVGKLLIETLKEKES